MEVEIPTLDIGIFGMPSCISEPSFIALLTAPLIEDCDIAPFVRREIGASAPVADADVGADGIHQLPGGTFYDEEFACFDLFSHFV